VGLYLGLRGKKPRALASGAEGSFSSANRANGQDERVRENLHDKHSCGVGQLKTKDAPPGKGTGRGDGLIQPKARETKRRRG